MSKKAWAKIAKVKRIRRAVRALAWLGDCSVSDDDWRMNEADLLERWGEAEHIATMPDALIERCEAEMKRTSVWENIGGAR